MNESKVWSFLKSRGLSDCGVAGLMGNLKAESGINPRNVQNSYESRVGNDDEYTASVDNGTCKDFVHDAAGYGIAQWTYHSRKENLLAFAKAKGTSIGDLDMQLEFLCKELCENYPGVWSCLSNASSIMEASNSVLMEYERPANQGESVQNQRASYGQEFYNQFCNTQQEQTAHPNAIMVIQIISKGLNVRKGPGMNYDIVETVGMNETFHIVEVVGHWGRLESGAGWLSVSSAYVRRIDGGATAEQTVKSTKHVSINCDGLRIRKGPGVNYDKVGTVERGEAFHIIEECGCWGRLESGAGWICIDSEYVITI